MALTVSPDKSILLKDGKPFFYYADTCWSAFTSITDEEWRYYLDTRASQGFNALQINILPQWDRSMPDLGYEAFEKTADGSPDWYRPNEAYFDHTCSMLEQACKRGFTPCLVVLWCDFIPDTWASKNLPKEHLIPFDAVAPFCTYVAKKYARFSPIYLVSGDTNLDQDAPVAYYTAALNAIKAASPECLTTLHLGGGITDIPDSMIQNPNLDFYLYQSGHSATETFLAYRMAQDLLEKPVKRPIINGEPCYDAHGFGCAYGRFGAFEVRRALWQSVLSGSKAGVTYGCHGIWSWHTYDKAFNNIAYSSLPFPWYNSIKLPGAYEGGFLKWIYETYRMQDICCAQELVGIDNPEIRVSASPDNDRIFMYVPYPVDVPLCFDPQAYDVYCISLPDKRVIRPGFFTQDTRTVLRQNDLLGDCLTIFTRR